MEMISIQLFTLRLVVVMKDDHLNTMIGFVSDQINSPTFTQDFVAEMVCGRFAGFCCRSDAVILLPWQSADCPRWQELTLKASAGVWKTSTPCVACACFSQALGGGS